MCFEVVLLMVLSMLAVFGAYSLFFFCQETWLADPCISVCLLIEEPKYVSELSLLLKEVRRYPLARHKVIILVKRELVTEGLLMKLQSKNLKYYII